MKALGIAVVAVVIGFLLGGLGPRKELSDAQTRIDDLKYQLEQAEKRGSHRPDRFLPYFPAFGDAETRRMPAASPTASGEAADASPPPTPRLSPHEAFQAAMDAQDVRRQQIKAALWEKGKMRAQGMRAAEDVVDKMNKDLAAHQQEIAALLDVDPNRPPDPEDLLKLTHDVSGILLDAQTQYQAAIGDGFGNLDPQAQQVWNQIDLSQFQDAFEKAAARTGR